MNKLRLGAIVALAVAVLVTGSSFFLVSSRAGGSLVPHSPILTALDMGSVSLDWNDVPNAAEYELQYRDIEWNPLPHRDVRITIQGSSAVVHGLPGGSDYAFAVRTRAKNGRWSDWSEPLYDVALPAETPLASPTRLRVTKRELGSVTLDWQGATQINNYQVSYWYSSEEGDEWIILPAAGIQLLMDWAEGSKAIVNQLPEDPERIHNFAVRAFTGGGFSAWSEVVRAPDYLKAPEDLIGWYRDPGVVRLDWPDVAGADTYEVLYWHETQASSRWSVLPVEGARVSINGSGARVDLSPFRSDKMLNFAVRAVSGESTSTWSKVVEVALELGVPQGLWGLNSPDGGVWLDWNDVSSAHAYDVRFWLETTGAPQWVILPVAEVPVQVEGSEATLEQLPGYASYHFQVRAVDGGGETSAWSEVLEVTNPEGFVFLSPFETPIATVTLIPALPPTATPTFTPTATPMPTATLTPTVTPTPTPTRRRRSSGSQTPATPTPIPTRPPEANGQDCSSGSDTACRLVTGSTVAGRVSDEDRLDAFMIPGAGDSTKILEFKLTSTTESFVRVRVTPDDQVDVETVDPYEEEGYAYDPGVNAGTHDYITLKLEIPSETASVLVEIKQLTGTAAYTLTLKDDE